MTNRGSRPVKPVQVDMGCGLQSIPGTLYVKKWSPVEVEVRAWGAEACRCKGDVTGGASAAATWGDIHHNEAAGDVLP